MSEKNIRIKLRKCSFGTLSMEGLGYRIEQGKIEPMDSHKEAMKNYRTPTNGTELLSFLGVVQFFSDHVSHCADRIAPLYEMLVGTGWNKKKPKSQKIHIEGWEKKWGPAQEEEEAFNDVKNELASPEFLVPAVGGRPKRLVTDASGIGYGAVLLQKEPDQGWRPVFFISRKLKGAETRYTATENEAGAVIFALRKLRPWLEGERFELVTDHIALKWQLSMENPRPRLARWLLEFQDFDYTVSYSSGTGELMSVPDALSRHTMSADAVLRTRCLEVLGEIEDTPETAEDEDPADVMSSPSSSQNSSSDLSLDSLRGTQEVNVDPSESEASEEAPAESEGSQASNPRQPRTDQDPLQAESLIQSQKAQFGNLDEFVASKPNYAVNEEGLAVMITEGGPRIAIPDCLIPNALRRDHGESDAGHFGITRTAIRLAARYYWVGWMKDVRTHIRQCLACENIRIGTAEPGRQAAMVIYEVTRTSQLVAMDVLTITPKSRGGYTKVLVMGDAFSRFMMTAPIRSDIMKVIAKTFFSRWVTIFGPPERLLSDKGGSVSGAVIQELCDIMGTKKISTTAFHPHTDGMVERYNKTICNTIQKELRKEPEWADLLPLVDFQYNGSVHEATGTKPYRAMFGAMPIDFDSTLSLSYYLERADGPVALKRRLEKTHLRMITKNHESKIHNAKYHDRNVKGNNYQVGERVYVYDPLSKTTQGRKLRPPWTGPWIITEIISSTNVRLKGEVSKTITRTHVNRLKKASAEVIENGNPRDGMYPDSKKLLARIIGHRGLGSARTYELKHTSGKGSASVRAEDLPGIVLRAYHEGKGRRRAC